MKCILANISDWPPEKVAALRRVWKNEPLHSSDEVFSIERSLPHGHVEAILKMIRHIGLDEMIASRRTRERDLVLTMMVERLIVPSSKLATTRLWHGTPLARLLNVDDADEDELKAAMEPGTRSRNRCRLKSAPGSPAISQATEPTPLQISVMELTHLYKVDGS